MSARALWWLKLLVAVPAIAIAAMSPAAAADFGVLSSIDVESTSNATEIHVRLNLPMRYLNHAPQKGGDFVEVQLRPVSTSEVAVLQQRQSLPWKSSVDVPLVDVIYEGNFPGTPTVVVNFSRPVSFEVRGGRDFRSIIIAIPKAQTESESPAPAPVPSAAVVAPPPPSPGPTAPTQAQASAPPASPRRRWKPCPSPSICFPRLRPSI